MPEPTLPREPDALAPRVRAGDRAALARAVTWVESNHPDAPERTQELLRLLLPSTGSAVRVGISGPPGAGKSTLIEELGVRLIDRGHRVAVLTVDPTSVVSGGSLLGDKTRMTRLSNHPRAFVRPSPSGGALGGVHRKSRESVLLCEAAGFDVVLVETVGVGQSEVTVAGLVDTLVLLHQPGAGDELQGIKRGILEVADIVAVTKTDGDQADLARRSAVELSAAIRLLRPPRGGWAVPVLLVSALVGEGVDPLWQSVLDHRDRCREDGTFASRRASQRATWMWSIVEDEVLGRMRSRLAEPARQLEAAVRSGATPPTAAAMSLLRELDERR